MAAAAGNTQRQLRYDVQLSSLLLVLVLAIGDAVVDAGACSPPPPTTTQSVIIQTEQLQGLRGSAEAAAGGDGSPAAFNNNNKQKQAAAGAGGGRRMLVGSRAPTCTYNECRGCRHRCSIQEVPIDASDPINSAYHYKCICHL
ncbi:unnamed protein product [Urochloa humidicola]